MTNTNCLEGFKCPHCGSEAEFRIEVCTVVTFTDDGSEDNGADMEWQDDSYCECTACDHAATVAAFRLPEPQEAVSLFFTSVSDGSFSVHQGRPELGPDPVAHDIPTKELAQLFAASRDILAAAQEALDTLTDLSIDLDGEPEAYVAGVRLRLDEAIAKAKGGAE